MIFNKHSPLQGTHAFLSASNHHWVGYTEERLIERFRTSQAAQRGTELHAFASEAIRLRRKQPKNNDSLNMYVNDAIAYRMTPEQLLVYSENCYGTADAIGFGRKTLRIYDYKSGVVKASERQLHIYAGLFCLEYGVRPFDITMDLRIYQNNEITYCDPDPDIVVRIIDKIIVSDKIIEELKAEALL